MAYLCILLVFVKAWDVSYIRWLITLKHNTSIIFKPSALTIFILFLILYFFLFVLLTRSGVTILKLKEIWAHLSWRRWAHAVCSKHTKWILPCLSFRTCQACWRWKKKQAVIMSDCVLTCFLTSVNVRLPPGGRYGNNSPVTCTISTFICMILA